MTKTKELPISDLFHGFQWDDTKIHVAQKSGKVRPIDVFTADFDHWQNGWNGNFHRNHCWNRTYIFSIIELPNQPSKWLFGGVFRVISYKPGINKRNGKDGMIYKVDLEEYGKPLIGRLIIHWQKDARAKGRKPENMLDSLSISEILPERYAGEAFPGYGSINHNYAALESIWEDCKPDWLNALINCQGVYLITDTLTGLRYIGSAYGNEGIWSRWGDYFRTGGHGGNKKLKRFLNLQKNSAQYARENFQFCLLEHISSRDSDEHVIDREAFWKEALLTRTEFGLNEN